MIYTDNEEYFATGLKYSDDNGLTPLITILCTKNGTLAIFADNNKLTHDQKVQTLQMAANVVAKGAGEQRKGLIMPNNNLKIRR